MFTSDTQSSDNIINPLLFAWKLMARNDTHMFQLSVNNDNEMSRLTLTLHLLHLGILCSVMNDK